MRENGRGLAKGADSGHGENRARYKLLEYYLRDWSKRPGERRGSLGARTWASSKRDDTLWEMIGRARTVLESPGV